MAQTDYSQDIRNLEISLPYFTLKTDDLSPGDLKVLGKAYGIYESYCEKILHYRFDPRIVDIPSFHRLVKISEIQSLISKLTEIDEEAKKETAKEIKQEEASIPPELESLVAEYEQNKALLESEEIKSNDQKSVAEQVKIAIAHRQIVDRAQANHERRTEAGEIFQTEDKALVTYGSPKSESRTAALAASYKAIQEVAFNNERFSQLSPTVQNRIISEAVDLNTISVTNINVAIESAALLIDTSDLSPEEQRGVSEVSSKYVRSVSEAVNTQTRQAATYESQIAENEVVLLQLEKESQSLQGKALEDKSLQIKSLVSLNQNLSHKIDSLPHQFDVFINNQTTDFQQFQKDSQARLQKDQDLLDRIDLANKSIASLHENLENHGVKAHLYTPLDEADQLETAIRQDMPGTLRPNSGYKAEYAAALIPNSETQIAALLYGKDLTPKLLAQARQFAQNNPESALGKLFQKHQDIFDSAGSQLRKIAGSPLGKEISRATTGLSKTFGSVTKFFGQISDKIPGGFGTVFQVIQDPWGALRSWAGRKTGEFIYKQLAQRLTSEALKQGAEILLKNGLKEGVKKLIGQAAVKLAAKTGTKIALEAAALAVPIPGVDILLAIAVDIIFWIGEKIFGAAKAMGKAIYGEEVKAHDLLAAPALGLGAVVGGIASFFATIGSATVVAASSAVGIITIGTLIGFIFYITSFAVAPLLSTLVQLDSTVRSNTGSSIASCSAEITKLPFANTVSSGPANKAWNIVNNLQQGFWCYWNKSPDYPLLFNEEKFQADPSPMYPGWISECDTCLFWCTDLVDKSYTESQTPMLRVSNYLNADTMALNFISENRYLKRSVAKYSNISPGAAVFFHVVGGPDRINHVGIVYSVSPDAIVFVQSNAGTKYGSLTISTDGTPQDLLPYIQVDGFGGVINL